MSAELGHVALWLAAAAAAAQGWLGLRAQPPAGSSPQTTQTMQALARLSTAQGAFLVAAFVLLMLGFVRSDFSLALVAAHSHAAKPLIYRITGLWGNHEGSMLLWCLVLAAYGSGFMLWARRSVLPQARGSAPQVARVLGYQGALQTAFLLYVGLASNPFRRLPDPPFEGAGLNPILQDPALAAHPPFLYLGFVGLALAFCQALAFLHDGAAKAGETERRAFAAALHVWLVPAWVCLTIGIGLGSFWAYYELGWGGFWFWDPVENASLMPWLAATALLHSNMVLRARGALLSWVLLLAMAGFGLSLFGTFLVRAGLVSSVHAFASDPTRGVFLLAILIGSVGWGLWRYARQRPQLMRSEPPGALGPRAGALMANNVFLLTALATILLGTLYPLLVEVVMGERLSVGAPYFTAVFAPFVVALGLVLPLGVRLAWRGSWRMALTRGPLAWLLAAALGGGLAAWGLSLGAVGFSSMAALAAWLVMGAALDVGLQRPRPRRLWGRGLAHAALGILLLGVAGASWLQEEQVWRMAPGEVRTLGAYQLHLDGVRIYDGPNFRSEQGEFRLERARAALASLTPERRFYTAEETHTTEASFQHVRLGNVYVQLGERQADGRYLVRAWLHPLVWLIWLGGGMMALGGALAWRGRA